MRKKEGNSPILDITRVPTTLTLRDLLLYHKTERYKLRTMMNISVRTLLGEMLMVALPLQSTVDDLQREIYAVWPEIPLGCLRLRPIVLEDEEEELDHERALLRMGETLVDGPIVDQEEFALEDGMEVFAVVDESMVWPFVASHGTSFMPCSNSWSGMCLRSVWAIAFYRHGDDTSDSYLARVLLTQDDNGYFANLDTFVSCGRTYGVQYSPNTYKPGKNTVWYPSIVDCIMASPLRIPRGAAVMDEIQSQWIDVMAREPLYDENDMY